MFMFSRKTNYKLTYYGMLVSFLLCNGQFRTVNHTHFNSILSILVQWIGFMIIRWQSWPSKYKRKRTSCFDKTYHTNEKKEQKKEGDWRFTDLCNVSSVKYYLLQLVFSACVAAVKSRLVLHHCVVILFWSSGIMECTCMLFTFENGVPLMR